MIPARGHYVAYFGADEPGSPPSAEMAVEAFDERGNALVLGAGGKLVRASDAPDFRSVVPTSRPPVVAAIPASGWRLEILDDQGNGIEWMPIIAWAIDGEGTARPITCDSAGTPGHITGYVDDGEHVRLVPPEVS